MNPLLFLNLAAQERRPGPVWYPGELEGGAVWLLLGIAIAYAVFRFVPQVPWPRPFRLRFVAFHMVLALTASTIWFVLAFPVEAWFGWGASGLEPDEKFQEILVIGGIFYTFVATLGYSADGARRAAQAEAIAARTQLATLRSQLQPHFLFNSLHTIVQLIHIDQKRAAEAAELVAELLRRTLEEQRDEVPLRDEWSFVSRYLAVEQIRFGERLVVKAQLPLELENESVPSFALQTLVENAVQHGAAPRVAPTEIAVSATRSDSSVMISVRNDGDITAPRAEATGTGTGLARLRQRISVLYGDNATLVSGPIATGGYEAVLTVPRKSDR